MPSRSTAFCANCRSRPSSSAICPSSRTRAAPRSVFPLAEAGQQRARIERRHVARGRCRHRGGQVVDARAGGVGLGLQRVRALAVVHEALRLLPQPPLLGLQARDLLGQRAVEPVELRRERVLRLEQRTLLGLAAGLGRLQLGDQGVEAGAGALELDGVLRQLPFARLELGDLPLEPHARGAQLGDHRVEFRDDRDVLLGEHPQEALLHGQVVEALGARERGPVAGGALPVEVEQQPLDPPLDGLQVGFERGDACFGVRHVGAQRGEARLEVGALPLQLGQVGAGAVALGDAGAQAGVDAAELLGDRGDLGAARFEQPLPLADLGLDAQPLARVDLGGRAREREQQHRQRRRDQRPEPPRPGAAAAHTRSRRCCETEIALPTSPTSSASAASSTAT